MGVAARLIRPSSPSVTTAFISKLWRLIIKGEKFTCFLCYVYVYLGNVGLMCEQFVCSVKKDINSDCTVKRCGMAMLVLTSSFKNWHSILECLKAESFLNL
jgi:hypothetical protein